jgi:hypothetical protein
MLLTWVLSERKQFFWATLCVVLCFCVKGYGGIIGVLFLYQKQLPKIISYGLFWLVILNAALLLFISPDLLIQYYRDWFVLISGTEILETFSFYTVLKLLHLGSISEIYILVFSVLLLFSFLAIQYFTKQRNVVHTVSFLLIWVIVFNRAAESATYIIAMAGVILWYLNRTKSLYFSILFWATIFTASLFPTDILHFFDSLRSKYILKVFLCLLVLTDIYLFDIKNLVQQLKNKRIPQYEV